MRPIRLEIEGINSYKNKQAIDFEKVKDNKVFTIFGEVGAGKSTIIEAIIIALYGVFRNQNQEYLNNDSKYGNIVLEFEINKNGSNKRYLVERKIQENNKNQEIYFSKLVELLPNGQKSIVSSSKNIVDETVEYLVGLSLNEFINTVVVQQDKVNILLGTDILSKRKILESILNLSRYGTAIERKLEFDNKEITIEINNVKNIIDKNKDIDEAYLQETLKEIEVNKLNYKQKEEELEAKKDEYKYSKDVFENQIRLERNISREKELLNREQEVKIKKKRLEQGYNAEKIHKHIEEYESYEKKVQKIYSKIEDLDKVINLIEQEKEISKGRYENACNIKSDKFIGLLMEKNNLESASIVEEYLEKLDGDIKKLNNTEEEYGLKKGLIESKISQKKSSIDKLNKEVKDISTKIENIDLDVETKYKIFLAYHNYAKYSDKLEKLKQLKINQGNLAKVIEELSLKSKYLSKDREKIEESIKLNNYQDVIKVNECKNDIDKILEISMEIQALKDTIEKLNNYNTNKKNTQIELSKYLESKYATEKLLSQLRYELETLLTNRNTLENEIEKYKYKSLAKEIQRDLKENESCPVCGSKNHEYLQDFMYEEEIKKLNNKLNEVRTNEKLINEHINELLLKLQEDVLIEESCNKKIDDIKSKIQGLSLSSLENKLIEKQNELESYKIALLKSNESNKKLFNEWYNFNTLKSNIEKEEIEINTNVNKYKTELESINKSIEELSVIVNNKKIEILQLKPVINLEDIEEKVKTIGENDEKCQELRVNYSEKICLLKNEQEELNNYINELGKIDIEVEKLKELLKFKNKIREEKYKELLEKTKGKVVGVELKSIDAHIEKLNNDEELYKKKYEGKKEEYNSYLLEKESLKGKYNAVKEYYEEKEKSINQLLSDYKFQSIFDVRKSIIGIEELAKLTKEIAEYEEEKRATSEKIVYLKDMLEGKRVNEEELEHLTEDMYTLQISLDSLRKEIEARSSNITNIQKVISDRKDLENKYKDLSNKLNINNKLLITMKDKQFVEYLSKDKLNQIKSKASYILGNMTNNRYEVGVEKGITFYVKDNYSGGIKRSIETLSKGELSLLTISLSIAFALTIETKTGEGIKMLFLDGGFVSVDEESLQSIVESLYKIKENIQIGILTHVKSMKEIIENQIIVQNDYLDSCSKIV